MCVSRFHFVFEGGEKGKKNEAEKGKLTSSLSSRSRHSPLTPPPPSPLLLPPNKKTTGGLKVAIVEGHDIGGTCVNRGCVPSKALLAASGRVREMQNASHLASLGIQLGSVNFERQPIADHAKNLANTIKGNLQRSLEAIGVDILKGAGKLTGEEQLFFFSFQFWKKRFVFRRNSGGKKLTCSLLSLSPPLPPTPPSNRTSSLKKGPHEVKYSLPGRVDVGGTVTARDVMIATGSVPFVPPGIPIDGKTVFTSDHALKLEWIPKWVAIIGSGYIGLEFSDVYTALGSEVTFIEVRGGNVFFFFF